MILKVLVFVFIFAYVGALEAPHQFFTDEDSEDVVMDAVNDLLSECEEPGRSTMIGSCQECVCTENLQIKCSIIKDCTEDEDDNATDDDKKKVEDKTAEGQRKPTGNQKCVPYSNFRDECNSCACSDDGMHIACTKRYCPPGQFNKDGTIHKNLTEILDSQLAFDPEDLEDNIDILSADKPHLKPTKGDKIEYSVIDKNNAFNKLDDNLVQIQPLGNDRVEKNWEKIRKHLPKTETTTKKSTNSHDEFKKK